MTDSNVPRVTGLLVIEVRNSNPNGDPEREGAPRQRPDGRGEISPVSFKRKLRDLAGDHDGPVWQDLAEGRKLKPGDFEILETRGRDRGGISELLKKDRGAFQRKYWDARLFGNTFLEEDGRDTIRAGVAHFGVGLSVAPVDIAFQTWTSKSGVEAGKDRGMAPMAFRIVRHGIYTMPFFVNPTQAHKTGCTKEDVDLMLALLRWAYPHTRSVTRPQVDLLHAHTVTHRDRLGSFSDFALLDAFAPSRNGDREEFSQSAADYAIPTWAQVKNQAAFGGRKWADLGEYVDYAALAGAAGA